MKKAVNMYKYLKNIDNKLLKILLSNYSLNNIPVDLFLKVFEGRVSKDPSDIANFILDEKNGYELCVFGYRTQYRSTFSDVYNGISHYNGFKSTIDAKNYKLEGPKKYY